MLAQEPAVASSLEQLRQAADRAERGWYPQDWTISRGSGGDAVTMSPSGMVLLPGAVALSDLALEPGHELTLTTRLDVPDQIVGAPVDGQALLSTVHALYPIDLAVDDRSVFHDDLPVVACGPATVELVESLHPGDNGELTLRIWAPDYQVSSREIYFSFTTPVLWERFLAIDTVWAELLLASEVAVSDEEVNAVRAAAATVPPDPLRLSPAELAEALAAVEAALEPVAAKVKDLRVHAIGHSHIDLEWQWTWDDSREVIKRDTRSVLKLMDDFPDMTFTHSQPATYEVLRQEEPDLFAAVCDRIVEGRWEPATLQWVEGDVNLASGEAQVRQLLEGVTYSQDHLRTTPTVHLAPDTFGHSGNLPQLSAGAGARVYYHHRGNPGQASGGSMWPAYWWQGDDGTRLLAISSPVYLGPLTPGRVARDVVTLTRESGLACAAYFYGVGDHGGGPTRRDLDALARMQSSPCLPVISCSTLQAFADDVIASGVSLPEHHGESPTVFEGCYVSHADTKRYNRDAENELVAAETLATLAGQDRHHDMAGAWRATLFHQFHDIICGSAIREAYDLTAEDYGRTHDLARSVSHDALDVLQGGVADGQVAVTNPLGFAYEGTAVVSGLDTSGDVTLVDDDGARLAGQRGAAGVSFPVQLPAFGTRAYRVLDEGPGPSALTIGDDRGFLTVDTPHFFAMIRRNCGVITTLFDKRLDRELVGYNIARAVNCEQVRPDLGLGVLQVVDEYPHGMSSWVIDEVYREDSLIRGSELVVGEQGPVRVVLETHHTVRSSTVIKRVIFYAQVARIDIELDVDWQEPGSPEIGIPNLLLGFTTRQRRVEAWYETPFGAAERAADGLVVPALRWADIGSDGFGVAVLNDSKYGFDALGPRLRAHVIRTSYEPDPLSDQGRRDRSSFAVVPHLGTWADAGVPRLAAAFNTPVPARVSTGATEPAPDWRPRLADEGTVVIAALKYAHGGHGTRVIRLYESAGRPAATRLIGLPADSVVHDATPVETPLRRLACHNGVVDLTFRPFQVRTLLVD